MAKVLIIDDSKTSRKFLKEFVEQAGHTVAGEAENGSIGINLYNELKPDLVTLDITMPVMDGLETLNAIMESDHKAKVMMVTASGQREKLAQAISMGAHEFLTKPYEKDQVIHAINNLLK